MKHGESFGTLPRISRPGSELQPLCSWGHFSNQARWFLFGFLDVPVPGTTDAWTIDDSYSRLTSRAGLSSRSAMNLVWRR